MKNKRFCLSLVLLVGLFGAASAAYAAGDKLRLDEIMVGFASIDVTPRIGVPLAGFGGTKRRILPFDLFNSEPDAHYFVPSTGTHDPIRAKAMAFEKNGQRLIFVRLDLVFVSAQMRRDILRRVADLGIGEKNLILTATHTHSGPGALFKNLLWEIGGTDVFVQDVYDRFISGVEKSVRNAFSNLAPSRLFTWSSNVGGVQNNRRKKNVRVDGRAAVLLAQGRDGAWRGGLLNFAVHPVWFGARNTQFSGDAAAAIETVLEDKLGNGAVILFLNGAAADISLQRHQDLKWIGNRLASTLLAERHKALKVSPSFSVRRSTISLAPPRLQLRACLKQPFLRNLVGEGIRFPLQMWFSNKAPLATVRIGDVTMLTWPGEPTAKLGRKAQAIASTAGRRDAWVVSLADDYLHYFATAEEIGTGQFEGCASMHGAAGGRSILQGYRNLLGADLIEAGKRKFLTRHGNRP